MCVCVGWYVCCADIHCWLISKALASKSSTKWDHSLATVETSNYHGMKRSGKQSPFISSAHNYTKIYTWAELSIRSGRTTIITIIETEGGRRKIKKKKRSSTRWEWLYILCQNVKAQIMVTLLTTSTLLLLSELRTSNGTHK